MIQQKRARRFSGVLEIPEELCKLQEVEDLGRFQGFLKLLKHSLKKTDQGLRQRAGPSGPECDFRPARRCTWGLLLTTTRSHVRLKSHFQEAAKLRLLIVSSTCLKNWPAGRRCFQMSGSEASP